MAKERKPTWPLEVGLAYVESGECLARLITKIRGDMVQYADFEWPEGNVISPHCECSRGTFRRWIHRQLTAEEIGKLRVEQVKPLIKQLGREAAARMFAVLPDSVLVEEMRRRGYSVASNKSAKPSQN
jgi:hypothetical protein